STVLVGMGGIVYEKAVGTSSLTLSLPVSRTRAQVVRAAVGTFEVAALGVVPWLTVFIICSAEKMPVSVNQVAFYVSLLICGGLLYFALAVLVSSLVEGTYTAPAVAIGFAFVSVIVVDEWSKRLNVWRFITGGLYLDKHTFLLSAPFPWLAAAAYLS